MYCLASIIPGVGCMGAMVNIAAIVLGAFGLHQAKETGVGAVTMAGGVAANSQLRAAMEALPLEVKLPPRHRCTDNAAMIAHAGRLRLLRGEQHGMERAARAQWTPGVE